MKSKLKEKYLRWEKKWPTQDFHTASCWNSWRKLWKEQTSLLITLISQSTNIVSHRSILMHRIQRLLIIESSNTHSLARSNIPHTLQHHWLLPGVRWSWVEIFYKVKKHIVRHNLMLKVVVAMVVIIINELSVITSEYKRGLEVARDGIKYHFRGIIINVAC